MAILGIGQSVSPITDIATQNATKTTASGNAFGTFLDAATDMVTKTNDFQTEATKMQVDFAAGKTDDILGVTMAQEKALSTLNFTVQVTNKVVDAYREIMQIQL